MERHVHIRNGVAGCVGPFCDGGCKSFARFLRPIHSRESNGQTKARPADETPCLLIKGDCFVELPHLTIQGRQRSLHRSNQSIDKARKRSYSPIMMPGRSSTCAASK